jgi:hypothetical protein
MGVKDGNNLDVNDLAARTMLLHWELDLGVSMAELSFASLQYGSLADADRWKAHAQDALMSAAAMAGHLGIIDVTVDNQLHELAFRVSTL